MSFVSPSGKTYANVNNRNDGNDDKVTSAPCGAGRSSFRCRQCGKMGHLTIQCPLRTQETGGRARSWKQQVDEYEEKERKMPYRCHVKLRPGKKSASTIISSKTCERFWTDVQTAHNFSLYRDMVGVVKDEDDGGRGLLEIYPFGFRQLEPGTYRLVGRTNNWNNTTLMHIINDGVQALNAHRPLTNEKVEKQLQNDLLLMYNYFSLRHEGNRLSLDEMTMVSKMVASKDGKHIKEQMENQQYQHWNEAEEEEKIKSDEAEWMTESGSDNDVIEAINHISVSNKLCSLVKDESFEIDENFILSLHKDIMDGLWGEEEKFGDAVPGQ